MKRIYCSTRHVSRQSTG